MKRPFRRPLGAAFLPLVVCAPIAVAQAGPAPAAREWGIVVHGGAGAIARGSLSPGQEAAYRARLEEALRAGHDVLARGGGSVDAVAAAIRILEDSPLFNAGKGAVVTNAGKYELDAAIMEGATRRAGAVAGLTHVRNPIDLARLVMERSPHVMLVGAGAEAFGSQQGVEMVPEEYFIAAGDVGSLPGERGFPPSGLRADVGIEANTMGTVGAVALDRSGNLAAGTSTGGLANKLPGRVGDSPIIGAGTFADNRCGAISATGHGEYFIRAVVAYDICAIALYQGIPLRDAADAVVMDKLVAFGGAGGVIAMAPDGTVAMPFNTTGMFRGLMMSDGRPLVELYRD
jgi:beta-aspartyl-peptidase (threonine type)